MDVKRKIFVHHNFIDQCEIPVPVEIFTMGTYAYAEFGLVRLHLVRLGSTTLSSTNA